MLQQFSPDHFNTAILVCFGAVIIFFFYLLFYYYSKANIERERAEKIAIKAELGRKLIESEQVTLRSQMNPHFIFNCLNSIKLYTLENNMEAASEYLTKFSKLIRLMLENTRNEKVLLSSEVETIRLYMDLEAMRFKEKLRYTIDVWDGIDIDYIEIPPLLLQPYIENAIWHGLMHKEEGGSINISITMPTEEAMLYIAIKDDGVGRAKAGLLKSKSTVKQKSYGMKVTSERISILNELYHLGASIIVNDIIDSDGQVSGTIVTLKIPVK